MDREFEFRGQKVDTKEWIYGFYAEEPFIDKYGTLHIRDVRPTIDGIYVIPETVGQYTGLKDKNDKKIYEKDILKSDIGAKHTWIVSYDDGVYEISREMNKRRVHLHEKEILCKDNLVFYDLRVIGNIQENPELLEVWNE